MNETNTYATHTSINVPLTGSLVLLFLFLVIFLFVSRPLIVYPLVRLGGGSGRAAVRSGLRDSVRARVRPRAARSHRDSAGAHTTGIRVGDRTVSLA